MVQAAHSIPACCNCVLMTSYSCSRHRAAPDRHRRGACRYHSPDLTRALAPSLDPSGADSTAEDNPRNAIGSHDLDSIGSPQGDPVTSLHASDSRPSCGTCCACACALLAWSMPHERLTKRLHAWHCPSAPRTPLDPLQTVGAVQVGAAVGAEVVAGLYAGHRVSAHGALLSLACRHTRYAGIRFILLILAGMAPAAITVPGWARESTGAAKVLVAHHLTCQIFLPRHPAYLQVSVFRNDLPSLSCHIPDDGVLCSGLVIELFNYYLRVTIYYHRRL